MQSKVFDVIDDAMKNGAKVITTVEAFHKEPKLLYIFLQRAANAGVEVVMAPIETTEFKEFKKVKKHG